jgi:hypothetical protein
MAWEVIIIFNKNIFFYGRDRPRPSNFFTGAITPVSRPSLEKGSKTPYFPAKKQLFQ